MRIAIYEQDPRICGPMAWLPAMKRGLEELGHTADFVTFTKSGRERKWWGEPDLTADRKQIMAGKPLGLGWTPLTPDVTAKFTEAVDILNGYDFVILNQLRNPQQDKEALKLEDDDARPLYFNVMKQITTPWSSYFHGPQHDANRAPFMEELMALPTFTGKITGDGDWGTRFTPQYPYMRQALAYDRQFETYDKLPEFLRIGTTGRVAPNKGPQALIGITPEFTPEWAVELWGGSSVGLGASFAYTLWELALNLGGVGDRYGPELDPERETFEKENCADDCCGPGRRHTPINPFPWDVTFSGGQRLAYKSNYTEGAKTCHRLAVHVNFTSIEFHKDAKPNEITGEERVEFSTLEAIDAGSICVAPVHMAGFEDGFVTEAIQQLKPTTVQRVLKGEGLDPIRDAVTEAMNTVQFEGQRRLDIVTHNREMLATFNDPRRVAAEYLDFVL